MNKKGVVSIILILLAFVFFIVLMLKINVKKDENHELQDNTVLINTIKISVLNYVYEINLKVSSSNIDINSTDNIPDGIYTVAELKEMGITGKGKVLVDGWVSIKYGQVNDYSIRYSFGKTYFVSNYLNDGNADIIEKGELREMPKQ